MLSSWRLIGLLVLIVLLFIWNSHTRAQQTPPDCPTPNLPRDQRDPCHDANEGHGHFDSKEEENRRENEEALARKGTRELRELERGSREPRGIRVPPVR
jgi:hypothetical protein